MEQTGKKEHAKSGKKNAKPSFITKAKAFCKGVKAEFKKIIWPTKETLGKQTAAVLIISVILGGFIRLYDIVCQYVISFIK
jgi:preprotein translocase subunit SecE